MRSLTLSLVLATALAPVAGCLPTTEMYGPPVTAYQTPPAAKKTPVPKKTQVAKTAPKRVTTPLPVIISPMQGGNDNDSDGGGGPGGGWN
jgi:hypothetical protein